MASAFQEELRKRVLVLDGGMGTLIQQAKLAPEDFGGEIYDGCNEMLVLTKPKIISDIHSAYLEAGADIIGTNTFGANSVVLGEYDLADQTAEINIIAAQLARAVAERWSTKEKPRFVAGAIGPTTKTLSVTGGISFEELVWSYREQAQGLIEGGVDLLLLETSQDALNVKAGGIGIRQAFAQTGKELPLMISATIEPTGTTLAGQNIEAFYLSVEHLQPISIGLNCGTGPEFMRDHIRSLSALATCAVSCHPNAGLPDEDGNYLETPLALAEKLAGFAKEGWLNIAGGCCGTTPEHIRRLGEALEGINPRLPAISHSHAVAGIEALFLDPNNRPYIVGEKANVIGSKEFRSLIATGKMEEAAEIARAQIKGGAHVIDLCLANPDRDEKADLVALLERVVKMVKAPLMIDTTDSQVVAEALKLSQGKIIINSINLEDGEERFQEITDLIHQYGGAVVVGMIDEQGMAVTGQRKLAVAETSYQLLVDKYGLNPRDIIFDPLVFPVGTGDETYFEAASETIEGIRLIKEKFPVCPTILGISNVSFGLPIAGRGVLNAVFLYHCTKAGLDYAIVDPESLKRFAAIPELERQMAEKILFNHDAEVLAQFIDFYRDKKEIKEIDRSSLSLEERLISYVVEGTKEGLIPDLDEALLQYSDPLDIINGPLLAGMDEVGRLFGDNKLIVVEVLQSAEVMKAAAVYLEPLMVKAGAVKGKIILATVKGDVHDIGKNLMEMIFSNNGYQVIDLGIKVLPEELIKAYHQEKPDAIGLSGLLVKSAHQMVVTAQDLKAAGIDVPILVGGAALTKGFTEKRIAPAYDGLVLYAKDAMDGLELANSLWDPKKKQDLLTKHQQAKKQEGQASVQASMVSRGQLSNVSQEVAVYPIPDTERHTWHNYPLDDLKPYLNYQMILGKQLGLKGPIAKLLAEGDSRAVELKEMIDQLLEESKLHNYLRPHGLYRFFPAQSQGDEILVYDPNDPKRILERFAFPRQEVEPYLCVADFLKPVSSGMMDNLALLVVTAGEGIQERAQEWKEAGEYLRSYALQVLALGLAEAFAERMHQMIREKWGIGGLSSEMTEEISTTKDQGLRISFGYSPCPDLADQKKLFRLLQPEDIGVHLTESYMMDPEASISAMVFAHPEARYFNVKKKSRT